MATSGSTDFGLNRNEIISAAARKLGVIAAGQGETLSDDAMTDFNQALNMMVKHWATKGIRVWTIKEATLFPVAGTRQYGLGGGATAHCTETYVQTTLSAAEASGQTALSVTADDGISAGDQIGIMLDSGAFHWTTVSGAPAGDVVTVASALTGDAAAGNAVFAYTSRISRPLAITAVRRHNFTTLTDNDIGPPIARNDYQAKPNKESSGVVNEVFYDPQRATGYLYLWQVPASPITELVKFTWRKLIEDFDAATDDPDFPQEWIMTLVFNLAVVMAPEYDVPPAKFDQLVGLAAQFLDDVSGFDREAESVFFFPGR